MSRNTIAHLSSYLLDGLNEIFDAREARALHDELFRHYFGLTRADVQLKRDDNLSESELLMIHRALDRLKAGEPLQYITGRAHFMGMQLEVNVAVLIPRPETEELVAWTANHRFTKQLAANRDSLNILDVGTGSGCIALALKQKFSGARVHACDVSAGALAVAARNASAQNLSITFHQLDVLKQWPPARFDIIISNPPYIPDSEKSSLQKQVADHEPHTALFVRDTNALIFYKCIIEHAKKNLHPGGVLAFETHAKYNRQVLELMANSGLSETEAFTDMQGRSRGVIGLK